MSEETPVIKILLVGDPEVGKSTFLSRLTLGLRSNDDSLPPYQLPTIRDGDQPFEFNIKMRGRPFRFLFFDTASPTNYTLLEPNFIIMCFDISNRKTLVSLKELWKRQIDGHFNYTEKLPVMVLGLKRDLRRNWTDEERAILQGASVMPYEGLAEAQMMRVDKYAECSALTGELFRQVLEDIAQTAVKTTLEGGGKTEDTTCNIM